MPSIFDSVIHTIPIQKHLHFYKADTFPTLHPVHWLTSHFAVGGFSPLQRLSGMLTAHMTQIAPHNGFSWHPHRGLEIYTYVIDGKLYHEDTTGGKGTITARLTSAILPAGGSASIELPNPDEDLFLYFVDGNGRFQTQSTTESINLYDVVLATPQAETAVIQAGKQPLNYLSFYLKPFIRPFLS